MNLFCFLVGIYIENIKVRTNGIGQILPNIKLNINKYFHNQIANFHHIQHPKKKKQKTTASIQNMQLERFDF